MFAVYWPALTLKGANKPVSAVTLQTAVLIAGATVQVSVIVTTVCSPVDTVVIAKVVGATVMVT